LVTISETSYPTATRESLAKRQPRTPMAKAIDVKEEGLWGEEDDVFVPEERIKSLLSFTGLTGGQGPPARAHSLQARVDSRRVSSMLGSLHPHAGHSE
jgi:hypothetical protein